MGDTGKQVVMIIFVAFIQGVFQYPNISQHFGGGKPEKVIVFLKKGNSLLLPSQQNLEGRIVDLVFHRGTKYGFKAESWSPSHIVVIDQDKVDRIYAGSGVKELDPTKLQ